MSDRRTWPGVAEWLVSLAGTGLLASQIVQRYSRTRPQSAVSYYFSEPGVSALHWAGICISALLVLAVFLWLVVGRSKPFKPAVPVLCALGIALAWIEIVLAIKTSAVAPYELNSLPRFPINNGGTIGAQVFATYLVFLLPRGRLGAGTSTAIKLALCACLWLFQGIVFEALSEFLQ